MSLLILLCNAISAQNVPIYGGGVINEVEIENCTPVLTLNNHLSSELPESVDNSQKIFMPPVYDQGIIAQSCVQVAEIWYTFTYEINRARNLAAGDGVNNLDNLYHPHYTYNFLNDGMYSHPTNYKSGFGLIREIGCPQYIVYFDQALNEFPKKYRYWMSGYEKYYSSFENMIVDYADIEWSNSYESINSLKSWLYDYDNNESNGGLAIISVFMNNATYDQFPIGSNHEGEYFLKTWGTPSSTSHALTLVGYDDEVHCFADVNGIYTNSDINGNEILELSECGKGAFKAVNSYGVDIQNHNQGYIYIPYKLFEGGFPSGGDRAYVCIVDEEETSKIAIKSTITYPCRENIMLYIGCASDASIMTIDNRTMYKSFLKQGGPHKMHEPYSEEIEIGLNFDHYLGDLDFGKVFLEVHETDSDVSNYEGKINQFSVIDYRWGETFELFCKNIDVPIENSGSTFLSIDYDLLPHHGEEVDENLLLYSDMVSRFETKVSSNATLTVSDISIDMYESTITVDEGSSLVILDNATIEAKKGNCQIIINGDIQIGENVRFLSQPEASMDIIITNSDVVLDINNCLFENCQLNSNAQTVSITNSDFHYSNVICHNITKVNNESAIISNNTFNDGNKIAIDLHHFNSYSIEDNTIDNMKSGVMLTMCGDDIPVTQTIHNNDITNCSSVGIHIYGSRSFISENYISQCGEGIRLEDMSKTAIYGNPNATDYSQMNRIFNEVSYELYSSKNSFPWYFHYNAIFDNDNGGNSAGDPLIYYDNPYDLNQPSLEDIEYNCWGSGFNASADLYPVNAFSWDPIYCPPIPPTQSSPVESLYQNSMDQFSAGEYTDSKTGFMFIVDQYPETKYAQTAMCELVSLEAYVDNNYVALKNYYLTNSTIQSDTMLAPLASKLANECDIKLENYTVAVDYFENVIADPTDTQDSVYAIIDLGLLYQTMGSGSKSSYMGKMPQYKPKSIEQFNKYKLDLLSLLPVRKESQTGIEGSELKLRSIFSVQPNPVVDKTAFKYRLLSGGFAKIDIINAEGLLEMTIDEGVKESGDYETIFDSSSLKSGLYYCALKVDGAVIETVKMIVL